MSGGGQWADHVPRDCSRLIGISRRWGWARHLPGGWPDGGPWSTGGKWTQRRAALAHAPIPDLTMDALIRNICGKSKIIQVVIKKVFLLICSQSEKSRSRTQNKYEVHKFIAGQVRYGSMRWSRMSLPPLSTGTPGASVWPSPRQMPGPSPSPRDADQPAATTRHVVGPLASPLTRLPH